MSRTVIHDVVIPVVERIIIQQRFGWNPIAQDSRLEEFLEEEMRRHFGVVGANECQHLKEQLEEAKKNDPFAFEYLLARLMKKYVSLEVKLRGAEEASDSETGPPDRFSRLRKKYPSTVSQETLPNW